MPNDEQSKCATLVGTESHRVDGLISQSCAAHDTDAIRLPAPVLLARKRVLRDGIGHSVPHSHVGWPYRRTSGRARHARQPPSSGARPTTRPSAGTDRSLTTRRDHHARRPRVGRAPRAAESQAAGSAMRLRQPRRQMHRAASLRSGPRRRAGTPRRRMGVDLGRAGLRRMEARINHALLIDRIFPWHALSHSPSRSYRPSSFSGLPPSPSSQADLPPQRPLWLPRSSPRPRPARRWRSSGVRIDPSRRRGPKRLPSRLLLTSARRKLSGKRCTTRRNNPGESAGHTATLDAERDRAPPWPLTNAHTTTQHHE